MVFKTSVTRLLVSIGLLIFGTLPFQPISAQGPAQARPLGNIKVISASTPCSGQFCYTVDVSCPGVVAPVRASIKLGNPTSAFRYKGTILFMAGGLGQLLWEQFYGPEAQRVLAELRAEGFQTVQVAWGPTWFQGTPGQLEGFGRLACRPATVARWIYDNLRFNRRGVFCASGNSNGASELAYMLTHYGLSDIFSVMVLDGGPNWTRLDLGCLRDDPAYQPLWLGGIGASSVDGSLGFTGSNGPCARRDPSFIEEFQDMSVAYGDRTFVYPNTMVWFLFGENDASSTRAHGEAYYERLIQEGTPLIHLDVVPNTPHEVPSTKEGADMIHHILLNECRAR